MTIEPKKHAFWLGSGPYPQNCGRVFARGPFLAGTFSPPTLPCLHVPFFCVTTQGMVFYNDHEPYVAQWLKNLIAAGHLPAGEVDERSISEIGADDIRGYDECHFFAGIGGWPYALRLAGWPADREVWTASLPCPSFSAAGKRKGVADERHLWPAFYPLVAELRPATIFGEQVEGAVGFGWLDGIFDDLERLGYACAAAVLPACSVGAPHIRQRLYWVAERNGTGRSGVASTGLQRPELHDADGRGTDDGLADAERATREPRRLAGRSREGTEAASTGPHAESGRCGDAGGLGHADAARPQGHGNAGECASECAARAASGADGMANTESERERPRANQSGENRRSGVVVARAASRGNSWDDSRLIHCRDGKWRRIPLEPSIQPLVDRPTSGRVGKLRAAGNAIVPQVAAEFVRATL